MAEYAGYVSSTPIDWSGIAKGLKENIDRGLQERQKKIDEDNKLFDDAKKKLGEFDNTQSPTYNQNALALTENAKTQILDWNKQLKSGELTREEYKMKMTNLNEQYDSFINTSKQFDQYITAVNEKLPTAGAEFVAKSKANISFMNLTNGGAKLNLTPEGNIVVTDAQGGQETISIKQWTNIQNLADTKVDLQATMADITKNIDPVVLQTIQSSGAEMTVEDARQNPVFNNAKASAIATVVNTNNPSGIVSILTDNSDLGYQISTSDKQTEEIIKNAQDKAKSANPNITEDELKKINEDTAAKIIQYNSQGDGSLAPNLTDKMIEDAKGVASDIFESQLGYSKTNQAASAYRGTGNRGGNGNNKDDKEELPNTFELVAGYINSGNVQGVKDMLQSGYEWEYNDQTKKFRVIGPTEDSPWTNDIGKLPPEAFVGNSSNLKTKWVNDKTKYFKGGNTGNTNNNSGGNAR
jgi:hypothetical protein